MPADVEQLTGYSGDVCGLANAVCPRVTCRPNRCCRTGVGDCWIPHSGCNRPTTDDRCRLMLPAAAGLLKSRTVISLDPPPKRTYASQVANPIQGCLSIQSLMAMSSAQQNADGMQEPMGRVPKLPEAVTDCRMPTLERVQLKVVYCIATSWRAHRMANRAVVASLALLVFDTLKDQPTLTEGCCRFRREGGRSAESRRALL